MDATNNRFYRQKPTKPRTQEQFAAMLVHEYGYSEKLAKDAAAIVAGHGAFDFPPEAYENAREEMLDGWDEGTAGLAKAVANNRRLLGLPPQTDEVAQGIIEHIWSVWYGQHRGVMNSDQMSELLNEAKRRIVAAIDNPTRDTVSTND